jgi:hypothetical protein
MVSEHVKSRLGTFAWLLLPGLVVALSVCVRLRLLDLPLERDEGEFSYLGMLMLKGIPPFATAYAMKLPGIFGAYALIMLLFGQTAAALRIGLLIVNLATVALVYLLGRRLYDFRTGAVAAAAYAILSVSQSVYGVVGHATHFVVLFSLAGFFCLFQALDRRSRSLVLVSGFLFGLSFTMKQHAAPIILFALCFLVWRGRREFLSWRQPLLLGLLFSFTATLPYAGWAIYLVIKGAFGAFWFWTVQYASQYATITALPEAAHLLSLHGGWMLKTTALFWLIAAFQIILILSGRDRQGGGLFLIGLLAFSCMAVMPGFYFRPHYFVMVLPALALLIGAAATWPFRQTSPGKAAPYLRYVAVCTVLIALVVTLVRERAYLFELSAPQVSRAIYLGNPFPEAPVVADYLRRNTAPGDRIAVLGSEPQIFFYADRMSATGHLCMYGLMEEQPFAKHMQEEMIREVEAARPKYVVFVNVVTSWLPRPRSHTAVLDWSAGYLAQYYELDGLIDIVDTRTTLVWWGPDAGKHVPRGLNNLFVYRRKE